MRPLQQTITTPEPPAPRNTDTPITDREMYNAYTESVVPADICREIEASRAEMQRAIDDFIHPGPGPYDIAGRIKAYQTLRDLTTTPQPQ